MLSNLPSELVGEKIEVEHLYEAADAIMSLQVKYNNQLFPVGVQNANNMLSPYYNAIHLNPFHWFLLVQLWNMQMRKLSCTLINGNTIPMTAISDRISLAKPLFD